MRGRAGEQARDQRPGTERGLGRRSALALLLLPEKREREPEASKESKSWGRGVL